MAKNIKLLNLIVDWVSDVIFDVDPTERNVVERLDGAIRDMVLKKDIEQIIALRYAMVTFCDCYLTLQKVKLLKSSGGFRGYRPENHDGIDKLTAAHQHALDHARYHLIMQLDHFQRYIKK